ncbi:MAG: tetratricopeptide repeat protein [Acidobacteriaceae bacterium]|nr:tetratricopeptide repeat protein [Acidobacteriaceae bacterium]
MKAALVALTFGLVSAAQQRPLPSHTDANNPRPPTANDDQQEAERELQVGIELTRHGSFQAAIPHLKLADGVATEIFVVKFNLGLCYLGVRQFQNAIRELESIHANQQQMATVKNILAQAYIGEHQQDKAFKAFEAAAAITPRDERLYALVSDACLDEGFYRLGITVTDAGLRNLPNSARLFLQRGLLRSRLEEIAPAKQDFGRAAQLAPDSDVGYIAAVEDALSSGDIDTAIQKAREGVHKGHSHYMLLTMLGEALLRTGITATTPAELAEAQGLLERAVSMQPGYASAQISLGKVYLIEDRLEDAIGHLETARHLDPSNPAVYANLATAYRRNKQFDQLREVLAMLHELNGQEAARIGSATEGHNGIAAAPPVQ